MNALKRFGLGLLWIFLIPFILLGIAVVGVFGIINFPIQLVIMIVNFFRGKKVFPMFEEDEKAMAILQKAIDKQNGEEEASKEPPAPQQVFVQQNYYGAQPPIPPAPGPGIPYQNPPYPQGQGIPYQNPQGIPYQNPQGIPYQNQPGYPYGLPQNPYPQPTQVPNQNGGMNPNPIPVEAQEDNIPKIELSTLPQYDNKEEGE